MEIKTLVQAYQEELIEKVKKLVSYPSVMGEYSDNYPFGKIVADCLDDALSMASEYGFATVNLDNYAGYAEIGEGKEVIGILGHLDVVPAGEGWSSDPFQAEIRDGKLYGRGTTDDKGAVVCSMVAMKILKDTRKDIPKRIRLIMGCNEENGSNCLKHYVEKEGHVDYGFTPDGNFPGIHGEKGMVHAYFTVEAKQILDIKGGVAGNVVPNKVELLLRKDSFDEEALRQYFQTNQITFALTSQTDAIALRVTGVAAHASTPHLGINAISHALVGLKAAGMADPFVDFYTSKIGLSLHGEQFNVQLKDEFGELTFNVGVIQQTGTTVKGSIDIRFPIRMHSVDVVSKMKEAMNGEVAELVIVSTIEPLFFEIDSPLVSMLSSAYYEVTNDREHKVETIGGGTYAKGINNTIAFGCEFPGDDCHIHDADEFVEVSKLLLQVEIYVAALHKLLDA